MTVNLYTMDISSKYNWCFRKDMIFLFFNINTLRKHDCVNMEIRGRIIFVAGLG